ncbi:MAG: hypothetical protein R3F43_20845 [bacterium]
MASVDSTASGGSRAKKIGLWLLVLILVAAGAAAIYLLRRYPNDVPVTYEDATEHFLHGSIGGDTDNGLPRRVMEVLPEVFADLLPAGAPHDWTAFGFQVDPGQVIPIGFSERTMRVPLLGMNCALCHTGIVRASADAPPTRILGMGSTTLDLEGFFGFLFRVVADPRYTPEVLIPAMEKRAPMDALDRFVYGKVIARFKAGLEGRKAMLGALFAPDRPGFGPGRVDTFNPTSSRPSASTTPTAWPRGGHRQRPLRLHLGPGHQEEPSLNWDGNAPASKIATPAPPSGPAPPTTPSTWPRSPASRPGWRCCPRRSGPTRPPTPRRWPAASSSSRTAASTATTTPASASARSSPSSSSAPIAAGSTPTRPSSTSSSWTWATAGRGI